MRSPVFVVLLLGAVAVGCARQRALTVAEHGDTVGDSVFVAVINENYYDARVHVLFEGAAPYPLGTVAANGRAGLRAIPWYPRALVVEITLVVAGGTYRSDRIDIARGDLLQIRVPADLQNSGFFRRVAR